MSCVHKKLIFFKIINNRFIFIEKAKLLILNVSRPNKWGTQTQDKQVGGVGLAGGADAVLYIHTNCLLHYTARPLVSTHFLRHRLPETANSSLSPATRLP